MMNAPATGPQPPGGRRTNATAWRRGDRAITPGHGRAPRPWDYWPGAAITAVELAAALAALGALMLYRAHPAGTTRGALAGAALVLAGAGWWCTGWALTSRHRREVVQPLARAVAPVIGRHEHEAAAGPGGWLQVPADYMDGAPVTIRLPHRLDEGARRTVEATAAAKLGGDLALTWHTSGRRPRVVITPRQHPPGRALYPDTGVVEVIAGAPEPAPVIGLTTGGVGVAVDLDAESPHILVSAAPGAGKSTILRTIAAQVLHHGGQAVVLDLKRHSHRWARGLPNVAYARAIEDIEAALVAVHAEAERRNVVADLWDDAGTGDAPDVGPRVLVLVEEANATIARLKRHHDRTKERGAPKTSPAIDALADVLYMGRAVKVHVLMVAQSATAHALGGPEVRECFAAARILARHSRNAWAMLAGDHPYTPASRHPGRVMVITAGHEPRPVQVIHLSDDDARELATSGPVTASRPIGPHEHQGIGAVTVTAWPAGDASGRPHLELVEGAGPELLTLAEASRRGVVPLKYATLRQAKRRDPEFPTPAGRVGRWGRYTADQLGRWYRGRPSTPPTDEGPELRAVEAEGE